MYALAAAASLAEPAAALAAPSAVARAAAALADALSTATFTSATDRLH